MDILLTEKEMEEEDLRQVSMKMAKCIDQLDGVKYFAVETYNFAFQGKVANYRFKHAIGEDSRIYPKI